MKHVCTPKPTTLIIQVFYISVVLVIYSRTVHTKLMRLYYTIMLLQMRKNNTCMVPNYILKRAC